MKQSNKPNSADLKRLKEILEGVKSVEKRINKSSFDFPDAFVKHEPIRTTDDMIKNSKLPDVVKKAMIKKQPKKLTFMDKVKGLWDKFTNWVEELINPTGVKKKGLPEYKNPPAPPEKPKNKHVVEFEEKYGLSHERVLNLFERIPEMYNNANKPTPKIYGGGGNSAPLFYDPIVVDIHNEVCDEYNKYDLKTLVQKEMEGDKKSLDLQSDTPDIPKKHRFLNFTRNFNVKKADFQAKIEAKQKAEEKMKENIEKDAALMEEIRENINFYGYDLDSEKRIDLINRMYDKMKEREDVIKSEKIKDEDKEWDGIPSSIKQAMQRPENIIKEMKKNNDPKS